MPTQEKTPPPVARKGYGSDRTERPCANPTGGEPGQAAHPAVAFLQLLGKDPAQTYFRAIQPGTQTKCFKGFGPDALARANASQSIYFVTGNSTTASGKGGGVEASDITACPALFVEWDDRPIEWQVQAWRELSLPEPTVQVLTGGKSVHCYWLLSEPMPPDQWRVLQARLIAHCGSDQKLKDPCRLMRLPGFAYINKATGKPSGQVTEVVTTTTTRCSPDQIAACLPAVEAPAPAPAPSRKPAAKASTKASNLTPRPLEQIEAAAQFIPERVVGGDTYEECRRALCGCAAALSEIGLPEEQALDLLASKWPDRATAKQVLHSSSTREAAAFWAIAGKFGFGLKRSQTPGPKQARTIEPAKPSPRPSKPKERKARPMSHSKAMACLERCIYVQAQRERNSLRRRARLLKAAKDLGLFVYVNRQEIAQRVLEAKARCNGEGFKPLTAADRAALPKPVVCWLVQGLIPAGDMTILGGRPKVGKTRLALAIVAALLFGVPFLEFPVAASPPPVLLVTDDQSAGDTADMLSALDLWTHPRLVTSENFRLTEPDLDALLAAIKANPGALVVLDSLRSTTRALQHGENDPEIGASLYDLKQAVIDAGGTLLLIHHCNKAVDLLGVEALSGHGAISGAANTVLTLHHCPNAKGLPDKINPQRRLFSEGRSGEGCDVVIDRAAGAGTYRQVSTFEHWQQQIQQAQEQAKREDRQTTTQIDVLDALEARAGEWLTCREVVEALGLDWGERGNGKDPVRVREALNRLAREEEIQKVRAGTQYTFSTNTDCTQIVSETSTTSAPLQRNGSECRGQTSATSALPSTPEAAEVVEIEPLHPNRLQRSGAEVVEVVEAPVHREAEQQGFDLEVAA